MALSSAMLPGQNADKGSRGVSGALVFSAWYSHRFPSGLRILPNSWGDSGLESY